jgi:threonine dehydratase
MHKMIAQTLTAPTFEEITAARGLVRAHLAKTPLVFSEALSERLGCRFYLKLELFQPVGAFKVRGGINLMGTLAENEKALTFVSASAGNHGLSLAYAGRIFGTRVIIYMTGRNPNPFKVKAIQDLGAEVRLHGENVEDAVNEAQRVGRENGVRYIHHANEPKLIAGVGTMGLEIFEDLPDVDAIVAPIGAGSCICGNGIVARRLNPRVKLFGVQSEQAPAIWHAWKERHLKAHPLLKTEHEGLGTNRPAELTTTLLWDLLSDFVLVSDEEINEAIRLLAQYGKVLTEGAGAASLAGALRFRDELKGKKVVAVVTGGNLPLDRLARVLSPAAREPAAEKSS